MSPRPFAVSPRPIVRVGWHWVGQQGDGAPSKISQRTSVSQTYVAESNCGVGMGFPTLALSPLGQSGLVLPPASGAG